MGKEKNKNLLYAKQHFGDAKQEINEKNSTVMRELKGKSDRRYSLGPRFYPEVGKMHDSSYRWGSL